jgi:hypothetical protein
VSYLEPRQLDVHLKSGGPRSNNLWVGKLLPFNE